MIKKDELQIGSMVSVPQGKSGKIVELRENRAYIKFRGEKSSIPFPYKDLNPIPITKDFLKNIGVSVEPDRDSSARNISRKEDVYILHDGVDWAYLIYGKSGGTWTIGVVYFDHPVEDFNGIVTEIMSNISGIHKLQLFKFIHPDLEFLKNIKTTRL